jgi:phosphocarrier protein
VRLSTTFECEIFVACRDSEVDGKSIMGVMMLAVAKGSDLTIRAEGTDAAPAVEKLAELVANRFGEER